MYTYIVTYDLHKHGQNYDCIHNKLRSYGKWCHLQQSVWLIATSRSAVQIRDHLSGCLDGNDKLLVAKLSGEAAWNGYGTQISQWIKENA